MSFIPYLAILTVNVILILFYNKITKYFDIYDFPDKKRKKHSKPVPLVSFFFIVTSLTVFFISIYWNLNFSLTEFYNLILISTNKEFFIFCVTIVSLSLVGYFDDKFSIQPLNKTLLIILILFLSISVDTSLQVNNLEFDFLSKDILIGNSSIIFTIFCIFALMNAINMLDGVDTVAISYFIFLFMCMYFLGIAKYLSFGFILILLPILILNILKKIFLGDSGVYILSFILSFIVINNNHTLSALSVESILLLFFLPGIDMIRVTFSRLKKGKNPLMADNNHFHHYFINAFGKSIFLLSYYFFLCCSFIIIVMINKNYHFYFLIMFTIFYYIFYFFLKKISHRKHI